MYDDDAIFGAFFVGLITFASIMFFGLIISSVNDSNEPDCTASGIAQVHDGETMSSIADKHNVTLDELRSVNKAVNPGALQAGDFLSLPVCNS